MSLKSIKCKKCRSILIKDSTNILIAPHGFKNDDDTSKSCDDNSLLFLLETKLPSWIVSVVEKEEWRRGKLNCPECNNKVGSFDYTSGLKCACTKQILPPVHLIRSKVDYVEFK